MGDTEEVYDVSFVPVPSTFRGMYNSREYYVQVVKRNLLTCIELAKEGMEKIGGSLEMSCYILRQLSSPHQWSAVFLQGTSEIYTRAGVY